MDFLGLLCNGIMFEVFLYIRSAECCCWTTSGPETILFLGGENLGEIGEFYYLGSCIPLDGRILNEVLSPIEKS